jgi:DNA-binding transcriptional MerR regulator
VTDHHQIGEVAQTVGLSLRTIRYYEEIGLVTPSGRSGGGFRLYTEADIARLGLIKDLKPVASSLETMGELLDCADRLASGDGDRGELGRRLGLAVDQAMQRCAQLQTRLDAARDALNRLAAVAVERAR